MDENRDAAIILDLIRAELKIADFTVGKTKDSFAAHFQSI